MCAIDTWSGNACVTVVRQKMKREEEKKEREKTLIKMPLSVRHIVHRIQHSTKKVDAQPLLNTEIFDLQRKKLFNLQWAGHVEHYLPLVPLHNMAK